MHGIKVLLFVAVAALVLATGVFWFVPSLRPSIVKTWFRKAQGYTPAKTPQDCLDKFHKALKERDYETAAIYCDDKYGEQLKRGADKAKALGDAIDSLRHNMQTREITSPQVEIVLRLLDPFPTQLKAENLRESSDKWTAVYKWEDALPELHSSLPTWINKHEVTNAFLPFRFTDWDGVVELVKDKDVWKIHLPVTDRMRRAVDKLKEKGGNYKNAVQQVRDEVKNNPVTQSGLEAELKTRLGETGS